LDKVLVERVKWLDFLLLERLQIKKLLGLIFCIHVVFEIVNHLSQLSSDFPLSARKEVDVLELVTSGLSILKILDNRPPVAL